MTPLDLARALADTADRAAILLGWIFPFGVLCGVIGIRRNGRWWRFNLLRWLDQRLASRDPFADCPPLALREPGHALPFWIEKP